MSSVEIKIPNCVGDEYVLFPACAYDGNRFPVLIKRYPPMFLPSEAGVDMEATITDVPRLERDGSGILEVTTGDVATPCVAVWNRRTRKAVFVYTVQEIEGRNIGLAYEKGRILLTCPAHRAKIYRGLGPYHTDEALADISADIPHRVFEFDCDKIEDFYRFYFTHRKVMGLDNKRPEVLPFERQFEIQRDKFNEMNWNGRFYDVDTRGMWQPGWCGGGMAGYTLMKLGGTTERERAYQTLVHLFNNQSPTTGLFYGFSKDHNDGFKVPGCDHWVLIRKSADALYFLFKHYTLMDAVPERFITGTKLLADYFVGLWDRYGQLGQFLDCETGEIVAGNSTSGAIVPAALVSAYRYFKDERYLETAMASAEQMYRRDALKGYTTGGPGEILQCPDSESAFALLESLALLYEETLDSKWLAYSEYMACLCSSWVVSYNYRFPAESEFGKHDMKTIGSVFANAQNKHSAPGICTLSGDSLMKLYDWTGNELYKELCDDISLTISQYMSLHEKPIHSWDLPVGRALPQGFINERVNMSDWEGGSRVGAVFYGSCWSETSNLLTLAELTLAKPRG